MSTLVKPLAIGASAAFTLGVGWWNADRAIERSRDIKINIKQRYTTAEITVTHSAWFEYLTAIDVTVVDKTDNNRRVFRSTDGECIHVDNLVAGRTYTILIKATIRNYFLQTVTTTRKEKVVMRIISKHNYILQAGNEVLNEEIQKLERVLRKIGPDENVNILLIGHCGTAKTCVNNTILKALYPDSPVFVAGDGAAVTSEFEKKKYDNVTFWNIFGAGDAMLYYEDGFYSELLEGKVKSAKIENLVRDYKKRKTSTLKDQAHCVIIVAPMRDWRNQQIKESIRFFRKETIAAGLQPIFVLTKPDLVDSEFIKEDYQKNLYSSVKVQRELAEFCSSFNLSEEAVLPFVSCREMHSKLTIYQKYMSMVLLSYALETSKSSYARGTVEIHNRPTKLDFGKKADCETVHNKVADTIDCETANRMQETFQENESAALHKTEQEHRIERDFQ